MGQIYSVYKIHSEHEAQMLYESNPKFTSFLKYPLLLTIVIRAIIPYEGDKEMPSF